MHGDALLHRQYGLLARHQRDVPGVARLWRSPHLLPVSPRVKRHRLSVPCIAQHLLAAVLDAGAGALLWATTAARWWGFGDVIEGEHVGRRRLVNNGVKGQLATWHLVGTLEEEHRMSVEGVPIASPELTVFWHARMWTLTLPFAEWALEKTLKLIDAAWRLKLIRPPVMERLIEARSIQGQAGIVVLREAMAQRPPDYRPTDTRLEFRFEERIGPLARQFDRQVDVGGDAPIGRVDYVSKDRRSVIEINSERYHSAPSDREADEQRYDELVDAGFTVLIVWEHNVWHSPEHELRAAVRSALDSPFPQVLRPFPPPWTRERHLL